MSFGGHKVVDSDAPPAPASSSPPTGTTNPVSTPSSRSTDAIYAVIGVKRTPIPARQAPRAAGPHPGPTVCLAAQQGSGPAGRRPALGFGGEIPHDARQSDSATTPTKPPYFGKGTLVDRADFLDHRGQDGRPGQLVPRQPRSGNVAAEPYRAKHGIRRRDIEPKDRSKATTANVWISMVQKGSLVVFRIDAQTAVLTAGRDPPRGLATGLG